MSNDTDIIIATYRQANMDAEEMLKYIDSISKPEELSYSNLPALVKNLEDKDSNVSRIYIEGAKRLGGSVAAAVGASITAAILTKSIIKTGTSMLVVKLGLAFNPFTIPVLALPLLIKMLYNVKIKKYIKENRDDLKKKKDEIQLCKEKLVVWLENIQTQSAEIDEKLRNGIKAKFTEYKEKTKKIVKDVSVQIDDCLNTNTNKRILQYNEVILNQYRLQKELEEKVDFLFDEYNKLLKQKQELERQANCLIKLLSTLGCPEAVINQALNESEA